jgi:hypothetical protein
VGFVVDILVLGQVFSQYFGFPLPSIHRLLHTHHPELVQWPVMASATVDLVPLHPKKQKKKFLKFTYIQFK